MWLHVCQQQRRHHRNHKIRTKTAPPHTQVQIQILRYECKENCELGRMFCGWVTTQFETSHTLDCSCPAPPQPLTTSPSKRHPLWMSTKLLKPHRRKQQGMHRKRDMFAMNNSIECIVHFLLTNKIDVAVILNIAYRFIVYKFMYEYFIYFFKLLFIYLYII